MTNQQDTPAFAPEDAGKRPPFPSKIRSRPLATDDLDSQDVTGDSDLPSIEKLPPSKLATFIQDDPAFRCLLAGLHFAGNAP